jgi:hypothetical protein
MAIDSDVERMRRLKARLSRKLGLLPLPSRSRLFPTSATQKVPNSGKTEFGLERGGVRGYKLSRGSNPLTPALSPMGRGSPAVPRQESLLTKLGPDQQEELR